MNVQRDTSLWKIIRCAFVNLLEVHHWVLIILLFLGRKIPLKETRESFLRYHREYLRLISDEDYSSMSIEKLEFEFERLDEPFEKDLPKDKLIERLKNFHRKRHLTCWHDGSSISNHGHLQITFNVTYDKALFYTNEEYREKFRMYFLVKLNIPMNFLFLYS